MFLIWPVTVMAGFRGDHGGHMVWVVDIRGWKKRKVKLKKQNEISEKNV